MPCQKLFSRRLRAVSWVWPVVLACVLGAVRAGAASELRPGLVIESVMPGSPGDVSQFQPGDVLQSWEFRPRNPGPREAGTLLTPFDLSDLFFEKAPRGALTFAGWRQGQPRSWTLRTTGDFALGLQSRPVSRSPADAARWAAWHRLRYAEVVGSYGFRDAADGSFVAALDLLARPPDDAAASAEVWRSWADQLARRGEAARVREAFGQALALERRRAGAEMSVAYTLGLFAIQLDAGGDLQTAEQTFLESLAILDRLAPDGLEVARALDFLGYLALWRGDTRTAEQRLNRAEAIQRPVASDTLQYGATLTKLALLTEELGDLDRAETLERQALALNARWAQGSANHGGALMNLAEILIARGELAAAEDLLRQSVEMIDKPGVEPWISAQPHANLGLLAMFRGDLAAAQSYFELAVTRLRQGPESLELQGILSNLAEVARKQGRFAEARSREKEALAILQRLGIVGGERAARLQELARIELDGGGDLDAAEDFLRQAEAVARESGGQSPLSDGLQSDLGRLLLQRGRPAEAEGVYRQILSNVERHGPMGTKYEAQLRHWLGQAQRRQGNLLAAEASFCQANEILDRQRSRLGGSLESRSWFESEAQSYAFDCLGALVDLGRLQEAFHTLERSRTRVFLQLLGERDLRFAELPPELQSERARLDAEYDQVQSKLTQSSTEGADAIALRARLEDIKATREALIARLRRQSPRLAALQAPTPLDLAAARRALDPGTKLLAYVIGPELSYLFVVQPSAESGRGLKVYRLPIGKSALEQEIGSFRRLLSDPRSELTRLNGQAAHLYDLLVKPAESELRNGQRILIAPDGPLHVLPWAALRRKHQYLAEWRAIHLTPSVTVYAEARQGRRPAGDLGAWRLVALGDPEYPEKAVKSLDSEVRSALRRGFNLEPLPGTRDEIRGIAELFPVAQIYLGKEATEEHAKQASPRADLLHFAGHGLINERFPLDSALALTIPTQLREGQDNGLLQAWEIFENVRLHASLVTLSACDTALGREMGGEGILGLTRAFQFAGARTVLASLWSVSDLSTSRLMKDFYTYLRQGKTKDEALRAAQLDFIRAKREGLFHPYHWAGFSLYGDFR